MSIKRRHPPEVQKGRIVEAALGIIRSEGLAAVNWSSVGRVLDVKHSAVQYHYKTKQQLMRAIMRKAIADECLTSIGAGLIAKDPTALKAPAELIQKAKQELLN